MSTELDEIITRVKAGVDIGETSQMYARGHFEWELKEMLKRVKARDLMTSELLALIAILHPVHARVLDKVVGGKPFLRIVPSVENPPETGQSVG